MTYTIPGNLLEILRNARSITVLTGAGISAESGVPTFRDAQTGLWEHYQAEELATPEAFERNPRLVWEWYEWRRELIRFAKPNAGHLALVELEQHVLKFTLLTQNVDGLHYQAGSQNVIELHGNIWRNKCFRENRLVENLPDRGDLPPHCPACGALLRPDVVWFGEPLPIDTLENSWHASENCDIFLSIGTSGLVHPSASFPYLALEKGIPILEINPAETPLTRLASYSLRRPAGEVLPELMRTIWRKPK